MQIQQDSTNFNTGERRHRLPLTLLPCSRQTGLYGSYHVCATGLYGIQPVTGHAERVDIRYRLDFGTLFGLELATYHTGHYEVNNRGAFYPKIAIRSEWAVPSVFARGGGYVPFPEGSFKYCPQNSPSPCVSDSKRKRFRQILRLAGVVAPPTGFEAHHIKEVMWCGQNVPENGVFLPSAFADGDEYDKKLHAKLTQWWDRTNFTPNLPQEPCTDE